MVKVIVASLVLFASLSTSEMFAQSGYGSSGQIVTGSVYDPNLGQVTYYYNPATSYFYVPALKSGIFLNSGSVNQGSGYGKQNYNQGYGNQNQNNGYWSQNGAVGQTYGNQGSAYRNQNLGVGMIYVPGMGADGVFISR